MRQSSQNDVKIEALRLLGGVWGPKVAPREGQDGQGRRRGQDSHFEVFWPTLSQKLLFLEIYENIPKTEVFHGLERVWAPKLGPLGPKSRAREGSGQPKRRRKAQQEGSEQQKLGRSGPVVCQSYGTGCKTSGPRSKSKSKVYVTDRTYD